jgi:hypothetical protein
MELPALALTNALVVAPPFQNPDTQSRRNIVCKVGQMALLMSDGIYHVSQVTPSLLHGALATSCMPTMLAAI